MILSDGTKIKDLSAFSLNMMRDAIDAELEKRRRAHEEKLICDAVAALKKCLQAGLRLSVQSEDDETFLTSVCSIENLETGVTYS